MSLLCSCFKLFRVPKMFRPSGCAVNTRSSNSSKEVTTSFALASIGSALTQSGHQDLPVFSKISPYVLFSFATLFNKSNILESIVSQLYENKEIKAMITAFGTGINEDFDFDVYREGVDKSAFIFIRIVCR